jgi:uncharacterized repeat protein (TIGR01451 family)
MDPGGRIRSEPPAGLSPGEWSQIRALVEQGRYDAASVAGPGDRVVLEARNPEQGYVTTFRPGGIELTAARNEWRLAVRVTGYGRPGEVRPLLEAEPTAQKERVEYRRGPVSEWYANRPAGLEQGFTIAEPPPGETGGPLAIELATAGDLAVTVEGDGAAFADASGRTVVRYSGLAAWDADGRALPARMEASGPALRLVVETETARFPVTVDPSFVQEAQLLGTDPDGAASDQFGYSVAVSGDTAVVGAAYDDLGSNADQGSAYVFVRTGSVWSPQQRLVASDGAAADAFGFSVAISGDTVVVGSHLDDGAGADQGSAYVFVRTGTTWGQQRKLTAQDGAAGDWFGRSVAVSGDTAIVGAPSDDVGSNPAQGSAYVFLRTGTTWSQQQKLTAANGAFNDFFGGSVALSGDTALVGAPYKISYLGMVYVFVRSGTVWSQQQLLTASDPGDDQFGLAVAVGGDTAVVGAPFDDMGASANQGSAYVFVRAGTVWSQQQKLVAADGAAGDRFGFSVAISENTVVVGLWDGAGADQGSAYVFVRTGTTWSQQQKLTAADGATGDSLGWSVAVSGDTAIVGAPNDDVGAYANQGSAYAFVRAGTAWSQQQQLAAATSGAAGDHFGDSVAVSGDTAIVGVPNDDVGSNADQGSAYVFVRSAGVWRQQQRLTASDGAAGDMFGFAVAASGDTCVVGAWQDDVVGSSPSQGSAYVFVRTGSTWSQQQKLSASDGASTDYFGVSVAVSGDTAVVGAAYNDVGADANRGSAYVFVRSAGIWSQQQQLLASDGAAEDLFGSSVAVSGDTAVVGAYGDDVGANANQGSAYAFLRSGTTWSQQQKLTASDGTASDELGAAVAVSADTALVGASRDEITEDYPDCGSAYVFVRAGTVWTQQQRLTGDVEQGGARFGTSVALSGDRAVVGAPAPGSAYVFLRAGTTWSEQQHLTAADGQPGDRFGDSVAVSGDTAVVGANNDDVGGNADQGSAYAFGPALADLAVTKTDGVSAVAPGGGVTYTITVANAGPHGAEGALVSDVFPAVLTCMTTCAAAGGATCTAGPFAGNIGDTVSLPAGGSATYTSACTVSLSATGTIVNTATITAPSTATDPDPSDNAATDADTLLSGISIADAAVVEGDGGAAYAVFTVSIVPPPVGAATVDFATAGSSATSGVDFTPTSGRLTFPSGGSGPQTVSVPVLGDVEVEDDEVFFVNLANAANAAVTDAQGRGTIVNDDFPPPPTAFFTVTPCRIVDTRNAAGPTGGPALAPSSIRSFPLTGEPCGVPATAAAVSVNLTAVGAVALGHLTLFPGDIVDPPLVSSLNFVAGVTRANNAIVPLAADGSGAIKVKNGSAGSVHFVLDVNGYFE